MGLEVGTYISDLITTNPPSGDPTAQGDDHIRLLKTVLKNTFPGATRPFGIPTTVVMSVSGAVLASDQNKTILVDTTAGQVNVTMPALVSGDAGWECSVMKVNNGLAPCYVFPPSGNIQSGEVAPVAYARRCIPGARSRVFWTGSNWFIERVPRVPVGSVIEYQGPALPVGYEWPNGQTLAPAGYLEYATVRGGGLTQDRRGRYGAMADQGAGRIGAGYAGGLNTGAYDGVGGEYVHQITAAEMYPHTHNGGTGYSNQDINHTHTFSAGFPVGVAIGGAGNPQCVLGSGTTAGPNIDLNAHTHNFTTDTGAGVYGAAHNTLPPTLVTHFILVVE